LSVCALGPATLVLEEPPELAGVDPAAVASAAARYRSASGRVGDLGSKVQATAGTVTGHAVWMGLGAFAFESSVGQVTDTYRIAGQVLGGVAGALGTLASELAAAQAQAQAAQRAATAVNTDTQTLNTAYETRVHTQTATLAASLHHVMTVDDAAAVATPTAGEAAQAAVLEAAAGHAATQMTAAGTAARQAWSRAAAAFDFATAQAPVVQAAVAAARRAAAEHAESANQGSFWGGLANMSGFLALGLVDVVATAATDGGAAPLDEADGGEEADLGANAVSDFAGGGSASASEIAAAEEQALADLTVDGTRIDGAVAQDTGSLDDGVGVDRGDGRDALGKFTGAGGYGKDAEADALADYAEQNDVTVETSQVRATLPDGSIRYYDGLVENSDGSWTGIEVKSGTSPVTANQTGFDGQVLGGTPATATLDGTTIEITNVVYIRVP
jgi:hypothetical protein